MPNTAREMRILDGHFEFPIEQQGAHYDMISLIVITPMVVKKTTPNTTGITFVYISGNARVNLVRRI